MDHKSPSSSADSNLEQGLAVAVFWMREIDLCYGRVKDATADEHDRLQDAVFFAFALDSFLRASEKVAEGSRSAELHAALDEFRAVVPHAKDVRDILSHAEEHVVFAGRRQRDDPWAFRTRLHIWGEFVLRIGDNRYVLDGDAAWKAAHKLYRALGEAPGWMTYGRLPTKPGT